MNNVQLIGRLTKNVEIKISDKGTNIGRFTIAVNRIGVKDDQQQADFINCVAFGKTAKNLSQYCKQGSMVSVDGKVQSFEYEKDGEKKFGMNIVANRVQFLSHPVTYEQKEQEQTNENAQPNDTQQDPRFL